MSLSNILQPNLNNIYSNSLTMNLATTQPVAGNNTLWLNSSNNHLYRDGVDLEAQIAQFLYAFVPGPNWHIPTSSGFFSVATDSDNDSYLQVFFNNADTTLVTFNPAVGNISPGLKLSRMDFVYVVVDDTDLVVVPSLSMIQYTNGATNTDTPVPMTGTFTTTTSVNTYISSFAVTTPILLQSNQKLNAVLDIEGGAGATLNIYGVFCYFDFPT